ncbi:hypothetical protein JCGZ_11944 [Jatropha curcas]|uniref:Uncharacterized protein n=1 Tax=Jatropha curcas TaxID=180498 RepID=A0A067KEW7_JATCU|nr:hypothetical protein JCGZ_11944 [Jatropha curcas]
MMGSFVTRIATYLRVWNPARPIYDSLSGSQGTRLDLDMMIHMKLVEKAGDSYHLVGTSADSSTHTATQDAGDPNTEADIPPPFPSFSFGAGTSGAGPSFQGTSTVSNDEVLARLLSRMDVFDTRLTGMESMIADRLQMIEIMHDSLDSRLDTLQGHYQGLSTQLQTVIQLL